MRRALITGGSGAIGAAAVMALARDQFEVIIHAHRSIERANSLADSVRATGGRASTLQFDLTNNEAAEKVLTGLVEDQPIDVLVHSAGIHHDAPLAGMSSSQWHSVIDVSLNGL